MRARVPSSTPSPSTAFARRLRASLTEAENRLWYYLRDRRFRSAKFRRQVPIGPYVADFVCIAARLVVEVDGGQHSERAAYDTARTRFLEARGYRVMRFWNNDVMENIDGVMEVIAAALTQNRSPASGSAE